MSLHSNITLTGRLIIKKYDDKDNLVYQTEVPNLVVNSGKALTASRLISNDDSAITHMGVGDNVSSISAGQTELVNELYRAATSSSVDGSEITFNAVFGPYFSGDLKEAGLFNASSGGSMFSRTTYPTITKSDTETVVISWVITVG